jgi:hypothetical protein
MITEFRMILTGTFTNKTDRDAAIASLTTIVQNYNVAHPGALKRADISGDDYMIADDPVPATKIV